MAGQWLQRSASGRDKAAQIDVRRAHSARVYDYWLGGKDNFAADREAAEEAIAASPGIVADARANRAFLARSVRFLARERGVRQFLDVGTGLPSSPNTHDVAQSIDPAARVVYIDNDPIVVAHARAMMVSGPDGSCDHVEADLRDPAVILKTAGRTLDLGQPGRAAVAARPASHPGRGRPAGGGPVTARGAAGGQLPGRVPSGQRHPARLGGRHDPADEPAAQRAEGHGARP